MSSRPLAGAAQLNRGALDSRAMTSRVYWSTVLALVSACTTPLWNPRPDVAAPLSPRDSRHDLVGAWNIEFAADSLEVVRRDSAHKPIAFDMIPAPLGWAIGTVRLRDTLLSGYPSRMLARVDIDFQSILGRPMSCFTPGEGNLEIRRKGSRVDVWFTPGWNDCGFAGTARYYGDSLVGTWREYAYAGRPAFGRFRMRRVPGEP
jgi:hypothetical protein